MVINMSDIQLFQILKQKMGEQEAEALVSFVDGKIKDSSEVNLKGLATKEDIARLETKIAETKVDTVKWVFGFFVVMMLSIVGLYFRK